MGLFGWFQKKDAAADKPKRHRLSPAEREKRATAVSKELENRLIGSYLKENPDAAAEAARQAFSKRFGDGGKRELTLAEIGKLNDTLEPLGLEIRPIASGEGPSWIRELATSPAGGELMRGLAGLIKPNGAAADSHALSTVTQPQAGLAPEPARPEEDPLMADMRKQQANFWRGSPAELATLITLGAAVDETAARLLDIAVHTAATPESVGTVLAQVIQDPQRQAIRPLTEWLAEEPQFTRLIAVVGEIHRQKGINPLPNQPRAAESGAF